MNGILCAYLRATTPSTPKVEATRVAAALDGELHDVLGVEVRSGSWRSDAPAECSMPWSTGRMET
jgi:hypothetical protein